MEPTNQLKKDILNGFDKKNLLVLFNEDIKKLQKSNRTLIEDNKKLIDDNKKLLDKSKQYEFHINKLTKEVNKSAINYRALEQTVNYIDKKLNSLIASLKK